MIEKVKVRKMLAKYEQHLKEEKKLIENEMDRMRNACATVEMMTVWKQSKEYERLNSRWQTLSEIIVDMIDIRCDEMLNDY